MNSVILAGTAATDPVLRYTPNGKPVADFRIAVSSGRKKKDSDEEYADFFTVVLWGDLAESVGATLTKGGRCFVQGRLQNEKWTDKGGTVRYSVKVTATSCDVWSTGGSVAADDPGGDGE